MVMATGATGTVGRGVVRQLSQARVAGWATVRPFSLLAWSGEIAGRERAVSAVAFDFADPRGFEVI